MKLKYLIYLVILFVAASCGGVDVENIDKEILEEESIQDSNEDVASMITGTFEGAGTYEAYFDGGNDIDFKTILIEKESNTSVLVSSPTNKFPSFEITDLINQFTTIIGSVGSNENGGMSFNKATKKFNGIINGYNSDSTAFRFMMP